MKNSVLQAQLEGLHDIGLDRVNNAVAAVVLYVELLEEEVVYGTKADREQISGLEEQVTLLRAELESLHNSIVNPTPADAVPQS